MVPGDKEEPYPKVPGPLHTSGQFRPATVTGLLAAGTLLFVTGDTGRNASDYCDHTPTMVMVIPTDQGYRVRCLLCGLVGPENENPGAAWVALKAQRYPKGRSGFLSD